jgi:hypothetical protein
MRCERKDKGSSVGALVADLGRQWCKHRGNYQVVASSCTGSRDFSTKREGKGRGREDSGDWHKEEAAAAAVLGREGAGEWQYKAVVAVRKKNQKGGTARGLEMVVAASSRCDAVW